MPSIGGVITGGLAGKRPFGHGEWSPKWPTEPGWYWFFGYLWPSPRREPGIVLASHETLELTTVEVLRASNGFMYVTHGAFIYKSEGHRGYWNRIDSPVIPADIARGDF